MDTYYINNIDMQTWGIIPGQHRPGSDLAIRGAWDMPSRIGKCFHDWGHERGIEPYVSVDEIRFGGRDIDYIGLVQANSQNEAMRQLYDFFGFIDGLNGTVPLRNDILGTWHVYVRGPIEVSYIGDGWCTIRIPFREPIVDLSGELPMNPLDFNPVDLSDGFLANGAGDLIEIGQVNYDGYGIDSISFCGMGLMIMDTWGESGRPAPKDREGIGYMHEPVLISPHSHREIGLRALITQPSYGAFKGVVKGLYALLSRPGLRMLTKEGDALRDCFAMHGFTVRNVHTYGSEVDGIIELTLTEAGAHLDWGSLADAGGAPIETEFGTLIIT